MSDNASPAPVQPAVRPAVQPTVQPTLPVASDGGPGEVETADDVLARLPGRLARTLAAPELHEAVQDLLDAGWWPAHLAVRLSAAALEPQVGALRALLLELAAEEPPARPAPRWRPPARRVATEAQREHWVAEARRQLKGLPAPKRPEYVRPRARCAGCGGESSYFVTRDVRLCAPCTDGLATGRLRVVAADSATA